jgi:toxin YhaV
MNPSRGRSRSNQDRRKDTDSAPAPSGTGANVVVTKDGWGILLHPLLLDQLERVIGAAEHERSKRCPSDPAGANMKIAASLWQLILSEIPQDPSRSPYRQGNTLGGELRHWMRAKFGNGRFRLFFRYHSKARVIVFAWVNDLETLRTYGSRTDAYAGFRRMLDSGNPPDDWDELVRASSTPDTIRRGP